MVGTTRSRVYVFMNRFRRLGFIQYNDCIHVRKSLLNLVLHDKLLERNARGPETSNGKGNGIRTSPHGMTQKA
jgi:hypothetical protein